MPSPMLTGYRVTRTKTPRGVLVAPVAEIRRSPEWEPGGKAAPSTHTLMVDGAVPDLGETLSQGALVVDLHLSVPPPELRMVTNAPEGHPRELYCLAG